MAEFRVIQRARQNLGLSVGTVADAIGLEAREYEGIEADSARLTERLCLKQIKTLSLLLGLSVRRLLALPCSYCMEAGTDLDWFGFLRHELVCRARERLGLSQEEVAARAGLLDATPVAQLEHYFQSERDKCIVADAMRVAFALGLPADLTVGPAVETNDLIAERREALGIGEEELARRVGIGENQDLESYGNEFIGTLSLAEGRRFASILRVDLRRLIGVDDCDDCPALAVHPEWSRMPRHTLIRTRREELGLAPADPGDRTLFTKKEIKRLESTPGAVEDIGIESLMNIAADLGVPFCLFLAE
jgi:transcriptional regulator with XRE-family HTH domain